MRQGMTDEDVAVLLKALKTIIANGEAQKN